MQHFTRGMAEREGFEPSVSLPTAVFKTAAINHSTTSPEVYQSAQTRLNCSKSVTPLKILQMPS